MNASELVEQANASSAIAKESDAKRSFPKTHVNYWKARLEHRTYTRDGKTHEVPEWSVRIHFGGVRKSFDLETGSKEEAATKARDIYLSLVAKGWAATLAELKPKASLPIEITAEDATVGEFLAEVERTSNLKPKTFRRYAQCLRRVAAHIQGVKMDATRGTDGFRRCLRLARLAPRFRSFSRGPTSRMVFRGNTPVGGVKKLTFGKKPAQ